MEKPCVGRVTNLPQPRQREFLGITMEPEGHDLDLSQLDLSQLELADDEIDNIIRDISQVESLGSMPRFRDGY